VAVKGTARNRKEREGKEGNGKMREEESLASSRMQTRTGRGELDMKKIVCVPVGKAQRIMRNGTSSGKRVTLHVHIGLVNGEDLQGDEAGHDVDVARRSGKMHKSETLLVNVVDLSPGVDEILNLAGTPDHRALHSKAPVGANGEEARVAAGRGAVAGIGAVSEGSC